MPVPVTVQQMALTRDTGPGGFMERVQATLAFVAGGVLAEPADTPFHQPRAYYAQRVVGSPVQAMQQAGTQVVMGVNVVNATTYDEEAKTSTCTIADIDLESQIRSLWNALGGIDTSAPPAP
jgi:hypothetical protein